MTDTSDPGGLRRSKAMAREANIVLARLYGQLAVSQQRIRESRNLIAASRALIASLDPDGPPEAG